MEKGSEQLTKSSSWGSLRSLGRSSSGGSRGSLPRSNSWSDLVNASGDFSTVQELSAPSTSRPLEEENVLIDQVQAKLRTTLAAGEEAREEEASTPQETGSAPQAHAHPHDGSKREACEIEMPSREFLRTCLRVWQHRVDDAARIAKNFACFRSKQGWPYAVRARDVEPELRSQVHWLLDGQDKEGRGILVYNAKHVVPCLRKNQSVTKMQMMGSYLMERAIRREHVVANGMVFVVDCAGVDLSITTCFGIADVKRGIMMWKDAFPCKCKKVYLLNAPFLLSGIIKLASKMLSSKIQERIVVVDSAKSGLFEDIAPAALPEELGGVVKMEWDAFVDSCLGEEMGDADEENEAILL